MPVISAVGHETDFTIADFVADLRAPTPSAAAELAVPDIFQLKNKIQMYQNSLRTSLVKKVQIMRLRYEKCMQSRIFKQPKRDIQDKYILIDNMLKRLEYSMNRKQKEEKARWIKLATTLDTLNPLKTLIRGYTLTEKQGKIIKNAKDLQKGDKINIRFQDGQKEAEIL